MSLTLYHGPAGAKKTEVLLRRFSEKEGILIVPNIQAVDIYQKCLLTSSSSHGLLAGKTILPFDLFLFQSLKHNVPRLHPCTLRNTRNIIRKLLYSKEYKLISNGKEFPGFISIVAQTLLQLKKNGLDAKAARTFFNQSMHPELDSLLLLLDDYQQTLSQHWMVDEGDFILMTLHLIREGNYSLPPNLKHLYFDRLFPVTLGEREILKEYTKHFPELDITFSFSFDYAAKDDPFFYPTYSFLGEIASKNEYFNLTKTVPSLPTIAFSDPATEISWVVSEIKKRMFDGISPDQIGVLLPTSPYYHRRLSELLEQNQIPFHPPYSPPLELFPTLGKKELENWIQLNLKGTKITSLLQATNLQEEFEQEWEFEEKLLLSEVKEDSLLKKWKEEERKHLHLDLLNNRNGITFTSLDKSGAYNFSHVFILGFTDKNYPQPVSDHPFYSADMLNHPLMREILEGPTYQVEKEKKELLNLIQRTENQVTLTYPRVLWDRKEQRISLLATLLQTQKTTALVSMPAKIQENEKVFPKIKQNRWSITAIETYLKCPYLFYAQNYLGLGRIPPDSPEIPPDVKGSLIHRVMQQLLKNEEPLYREAIAYDLYLQKLIQRSEQILHEIVANDILFQKSIGPIRKNFTLLATNALADYLRLEIDLFRKKKKKTYPKYFEWGFGNKQIPAYKIKKGSTEVFVTGRIDRIDVNEEEKLFSVIDYKTGTLNSRNEILAGESLQIPLYLMAVEEIFLKGYLPTGGYLAGFAELKLSGIFFDDRGEEKMIEKSAPVTLAQWDSLKEKISETILHVVTQIQDRNFSPKPREASLCYSCDYRDICHYRPEEKSAREE